MILLVVVQGQDIYYHILPTLTTSPLPVPGAHPKTTQPNHLQVTVPDQKLPVRFLLRAHVTTTDLIFSPPSLDFGNCMLAEDTGRVLRVTNPSALPHTLGFVNLPQVGRRKCCGWWC